MARWDRKEFERRLQKANDAVARRQKCPKHHKPLNADGSCTDCMIERRRGSRGGRR